MDSVGGLHNIVIENPAGHKLSENCFYADFVKHVDWFQNDYPLSLQKVYKDILVLMSNNLDCNQLRRSQKGLKSNFWLSRWAALETRQLSKRNYPECDTSTSEIFSNYYSKTLDYINKSLDEMEMIKKSNI